MCGALIEPAPMLSTVSASSPLSSMRRDVESDLDKARGLYLRLGAERAGLRCALFLVEILRAAHNYRDLVPLLLRMAERDDCDDRVATLFQEQAALQGLGFASMEQV